MVDKTKNELYIVYGYLDYIHSVFTVKEKADKYVHRYNLAVDEVNKLSGFEKETKLYVKPLLYNIHVKSIPCVIYQVVYDKRKEKLESYVFTGHRESTIEQEEFCIEQNYGKVVKSQSIVSLETALDRINTKCGTNFTLEEIK